MQTSPQKKPAFWKQVVFKKQAGREMQEASCKAWLLEDTRNPCSLWCVTIAAAVCPMDYLDVQFCHWRDFFIPPLDLVFFHLLNMQWETNCEMQLLFVEKANVPRSPKSTYSSPEQPRANKAYKAHGDAPQPSFSKLALHALEHACKYSKHWDCRTVINP